VVAALQQCRGLRSQQPVRVGYQTDTQRGRAFYTG